jgi:hypothetical protein
VAKKRGVEIFGKVFPLNMPVIIQGVAFRLRKATNKDIVLRPFGVLRDSGESDGKDRTESGNGGNSGGRNALYREVVNRGTPDDGHFQDDPGGDLAGGESVRVGGPGGGDGPELPIPGEVRTDRRE